MKTIRVLQDCHFCIASHLQIRSNRSIISECTILQTFISIEKNAKYIRLYSSRHILFQEVEGELVAAETDLQNINNTISLTTPLEQIELAERDLSRLESTIPVSINDHF